MQKTKILGAQKSKIYYRSKSISTKLFTQIFPRSKPHSPSQNQNVQNHTTPVQSNLSVSEPMSKMPKIESETQAEKLKEQLSREKPVLDLPSLLNTMKQNSEVHKQQSSQQSGQSGISQQQNTTAPTNAQLSLALQANQQQQLAQAQSQAQSQSQSQVSSSENALEISEEREREARESNSRPNQASRSQSRSEATERHIHPSTALTAGDSVADMELLNEKLGLKINGTETAVSENGGASNILGQHWNWGFFSFPFWFLV